MISALRWVQSSLSDNNAEINLGERAEESFHRGCVEHIKTNPSLSCLTGKTSVYDPVPTCLFELCNYRPASALSFELSLSVMSVSQVESRLSQLLTAEASVCRLALSHRSQFRLQPLVWGGLCHQEGGLLNSSSVWEESVRFFRDGGRFACSDPLHLFISAAHFLSV